MGSRKATVVPDRVGARVLGERLADGLEEDVVQADAGEIAELGQLPPVLGEEAHVGLR
jgi:hypothetical protein